MVTKVAFYLRRSSDSDTQVSSIQRQEQECQQFAADRGWTVVSSYLDDAISGVSSAEQRSGFTRAVRDAQAHKYDVLLAFSMSRFSRSDAFESIAELMPLKRAGVRLATAESGLVNWENFTDFLTLSIQKNADYEYSKALGYNVSSGLSRRFAAGKWHGSPPRGFQVGPDGKLEVNQTESKVILDAFQHFADGLSLRQILKRLRENGHEVSGIAVIRHWLRSEAYIGTYQQGGGTRRTKFKPTDTVRIENNHERLVPDELWQAAQARISNAHSFPPTSPDNADSEYLLTGLLKCGRCGSTYKGRRAKNGARGFSCSGSARGTTDCRGRWIAESDVLDSLLGAVQIITTPASIAKVQAEIDRQIAEMQADDESGAIRKRLERLNKDISTATDNILALSNPRLVSAAETRLTEMIEQAAALQIELDEIGKPSDRIELLKKAADLAKSRVEDVGRLRDAEPASAKRILRSIFKSVTVNGDYATSGRGKPFVVNGGIIMLNEPLDNCCVGNSSGSD